MKLHRVQSHEFSLFTFAFFALSCSLKSCNSSHFTIEFTIEKFVWHYCVQSETNFICVLFGGKFVSHWKYKDQINFENSKCIILKNKRPKIRLSLWKFQCKTDLRHRKNAEGKKRLMQNKPLKNSFSLWKYQYETDLRHRKMPETAFCERTWYR